MYVWERDLTSTTVHRFGNPEQVLGIQVATIDDFLQRVHIEERAQVRYAIEGVIQRGEPYELLFRIQPLGADRPIWVRDVGRRVQTPGGDRFLGVCMDVTPEVEALRQAEAERLARVAAESAAAAKSRFLANVSHELRTPLNAIIGFAEILQEDLAAGAGGNPRDCDRILSAARRLLQKIGDLLDFEKLDAGKMTPHLSTFDPRVVTQEAIDMLRPIGLSCGTVLEHQIEGDLGEMHSDSSMLWQCLVNLLSNAVKFTPGGIVRLRCRREGPILRFAVIDSGAGIPADLIQTLFQPFSQAHAPNRGNTGTGLGLVITRQLAHLLGGDVTVQSVLGQGSTYELSVAADCPRPLHEPHAG